MNALTGWDRQARGARVVRLSWRATPAGGIEMLRTYACQATHSIQSVCLAYRDRYQAPGNPLDSERPRLGGGGRTAARAVARKCLQLRKAGGDRPPTSVTLWIGHANRECDQVLRGVTKGFGDWVRTKKTVSTQSPFRFAARGKPGRASVCDS